MALYDVDFVEWTREQTALLRALPAETSLDIENLAEEIEGVGRQAVSQLSVALIRVLVNLVLIAVSPDASGSKPDALNAQIEALILKGQGVERHVDFPRIWRLATRDARAGLEAHELNAPSMPEKCPLSLDQLLAEEFDPREAVKIIAAAMVVDRR